MKNFLWRARSIASVLVLGVALGQAVACKKKDKDDDDAPKKKPPTDPVTPTPPAPTPPAPVPPAPVPPAPTPNPTTPLSAAATLAKCFGIDETDVAPLVGYADEAAALAAATKLCDQLAVAKFADGVKVDVVTTDVE